MSLTVVQRFYEVAKQESEAPALGIECDGVYQNLPWWFVKSKAKHFGLGLLEEGASPGDYFYLFPSKNPNWIYAELGALTIGLKTVPLPANLPEESLEAILRKYPPAFCYLENGGETRLLPHQKILKSLRRLILPSDPEAAAPHPSALPEKLSFRRIFNSGIVSESHHHSRYREIRRSLHDEMIMSPIQIDAKGCLVEKPLLYGEVNAMIANLSYQCRNVRFKRLYTEMDLSHTAGRVAGLYWPIFLSIQFFPSTPSPRTFLQIKKSRAQVALLSPGRMEEMGESARRLSEKYASAFSGKKFAGGWLKRFWIRRQLQRFWGSNLKLVFSSEEILPEDKQSLSMIAKIETHSLDLERPTSPQR